MKLFFLEEMFQLATFAFYACPMTKLLTLSWWKFYDVIDVLFILPYICVSFPKETIKDFVEGFGFTFQDNGGRYWSWFYSKRYIYIFCTFLQKIYWRSNRECSWFYDECRGLIIFYWLRLGRQIFSYRVSVLVAER